MAPFNSLLGNFWNCLRLHRDALRSDLCLPIYGQIAIIALFLLVYRSTNIPWQVVTISLFIVLSYPLLAILYGDGKGFLILIVSLILGGIISRQHMLLLIMPITLILLINFFISVLTDSQTIYKRLPAISGMLLLTFFGFKYYFRLESPYVNPDDLYNLTLLKQHLDTDGSMHMAITNMILHCGYPSTGYHLTPLVLYHCLGHYVMAAFCLMTGLSVFNLYYFNFGFFIFPLIVISIVVLIRQLYPEAKWSYFFFSLIFFCSFGMGTALGKLENPVQYGFGVDQSLPLSVIFIFWVYRNLGRRDVQWTIPLLIALSFYAKASTGATMFCAYLLTVAFSDQPIISKFKYVAVTVCLSAIPIYFVSQPAVSNTLHFKFYSYYHDYVLPVEKRKFLTALWEQYNIPIISMIILVLYLQLRGLIHIKVIWHNYRALVLFAIGTVIAGVSAGAFTFPDGNHRYFTNVVTYLFLPLGAVSMEKIIFLRGNRFIKLLSFSILLTFSINALLIMADRFDYYRKFHISRHKAISGHIEHYKVAEMLSYRLNPLEPKFEDPARIKPYYKALLFIKNNYSGKKCVVEIPQTETGFWNYTIYPYPRVWMSSYIPAISGKPAWNGYDYRYMKEKKTGSYTVGGYGYAAYYRQKDNIDYCKDADYEGKLIVQSNEDTHIELIESNCNGSIHKVTIE